MREGLGCTGQALVQHSEATLGVPRKTPSAPAGQDWALDKDLPDPCPPSPCNAITIKVQGSALSVQMSRPACEALEAAPREVTPTMEDPVRQLPGRQGWQHLHGYPCLC